MGFRSEFDPVNKILLLRFDGRLTEELIQESYPIGQKHWTATDPQMSIVDFSCVTEAVLSTEFLTRLAQREPVGDVTNLPRVIVAPSTFLFGISRMFQILGEHTRPQLQVVNTLNEAFSALGVQPSPHLESLQ
jgi:hypothetical protein